MDLFKRASNKMATALDWNCPKVCKRCKGDTQRIHKQARTKLKRYDKQVEQDVIDFWNSLVKGEE